MSTKDLSSVHAVSRNPFGRITDGDGFRLKNFDPGETLHLDSEDRPRAIVGFRFCPQSCRSSHDDRQKSG